MDDTEKLTGENPRKNFGITLIEWIRIVNNKKFNGDKQPEKSSKNGQSENRGHTDLFSVNIKSNNIKENLECRAYW
jgi:hypothetical protein